MLSNLKRTVALAALIAGMTVGAAHATEGWYGRIDAGASIEGEIDNGAAFDLDDGWMASLGAGYGFLNGFRAEGALDYRTNEVEGLDVDADAWALMANLYYDFNRGGTLQPYLGLGAGWVNLDIDDEDEDGWAYQGLAGIGWRVTEQTTIDLGYRYFEAPEVEFAGGDVDYTHQAVTLGLRYAFGAAPPPPLPPPPPPPPAPPPPPPASVCPQSDFVVYFEWDRSNLNQAAIETIDAAAARAQQCNVGGVVVVGHTDTSGSQEYNQGLSERRAGVVRDALVARGIAAGTITTQARGETDLAQQTRDGVREPLNRRTAVTISFR